MTTYDGAEINARWGNGWPADARNPHDPRHEFSPVLEAPVANLLGEPWYLESSSPGGDFVIWLNVAGGRVGVSPHPDSDGLMRWAIQMNDDDLGPVQGDYELPITTDPLVVAERVRWFLAEHGIEQPDV